MTVATQVRNLKDGKLIIRDGSGSGFHSIEIPIEEGNLKWTETDQIHDIHDRSDLVGFKKGKDVPCEFSFSFGFVTYTGDSDENEVTPIDAMTGSAQALAEGWTSTEVGDVWGFDLEFQVTAPDGSKSEKIVFPSSTTTKREPGEADEMGKVDVSGKCLATKPTVTRVSSFD